MIISTRVLTIIVIVFCLQSISCKKDDNKPQNTPTLIGDWIYAYDKVKYFKNSIVTSDQTYVTFSETLVFSFFESGNYRAQKQNLTIDSGSFQKWESRLIMVSSDGISYRDTINYLFIDDSLKLSKIEEQANLRKESSTIYYKKN